ncbi:hypothetical protein H6F44_22315 [Pseudanabaena sp. FACHB-1277]|uniref:Uncharacterized protein n=1 Tax=Pseudanabaena cinerea FACHB-1277 TaxID=2949581 RepID=A0A926Z8L2_9CYAN|nr:hypothetical protein [Pseudanabaena cinerea]MBD2152823.1 hypothetical protein [Pseudanabaena cinerea FACHB-1277]
MQSVTGNAVESGLITPIPPLIGSDKLLGNTLIPQNSLNSNLSPLGSSLSTGFVVKSLSPSESAIYLNGIGIPLSDTSSLATVPVISDGNIISEQGFTVGSMPNSLTFIGSNLVDNLHLKLNDNNVFSFSQDGINFNSLDWLNILTGRQKIWEV